MPRAPLTAVAKSLCGSRWARAACVFCDNSTEALLVSSAGGALGLWGGLLLLRSLRTWQPFPQWPINIPITPDAKVYAAAVVLIVVSGFLFGAVPVRQVLRTDPYEIVKAGSRTTASRSITIRDLLLVGQISICAVLITSSLVAVRALAA